MLTYKLQALINHLLYYLLAEGVESSIDDEMSEEESDDDSEIEFDGPGFGFDEDSLNEEASDEDWSEERKICHVLPFSAKTGPQVLGLQKPIEYFNHIVSQQFLEILLKNMNHQAVQLYLSKNSAFLGLKEFKPFTVDELKVFLGLVLHMGIIQMTEINEYWNTNEFFGLQFFAKHMTRKKFRMMWKCLDFDPKVREGCDIKEIINEFNNILEEAFLPDKVLCIDKTKIGGRRKKNAFASGVKETDNIYLLTDEFGYVLKLVPSKNKNESINEITETLLSSRLGVGHAVYINNPSIQFANHLVQYNTHVTGVVKTKPKEIPITGFADSNLVTSETVTLYSKRGICVTKWQNRLPSFILSTEHNEDFQSNVPKKENKRKPSIVALYEKNMSGIKKHEHLVSYFSSMYTQKKLTRNKRLILHILNVMFCNSYILYKRYSERPLNIHDFRLAIIEALVSVNKNAKVIPENIPKNNWHTPYKLPRDPKTNRFKRKRCVNCWKKLLKRVDTISYCPKCPNNPGLCQGQCFEEYHSSESNL